MPGSIGCLASPVGSWEAEAPSDSGVFWWDYRPFHGLSLGLPDWGFESNRRPILFRHTLIAKCHLFGRQRHRLDYRCSAAQLGLASGLASLETRRVIGGRYERSNCKFFFTALCLLGPTAWAPIAPVFAAEILDDRVRKYLCPDKITSSQWAYVMEVAHSLGMKSTATIMFGHIDDIDSWVNHFSLIKNIQLKTGGFTEVVPLPFVHMGSPIYLQGKSMPGPTWDEVVLIHSLARIYFSNVINNIQASWVKLGHDGAGKLLDAGVNDLGGTLINENISRASGADHGQETTDQQFIDIIENCNKTPILRNTLYTEFKNPKTLIPYS